MPNFADDNALSTLGETVSKLIGILGSESNVGTDWFTKNEMIINTGHRFYWLLTQGKIQGTIFGH